MQALSRTTVKAPLRALTRRAHALDLAPPCAHFLRPPHPSSAGSKFGHIPADIEQATGLECLQLLGRLHRVDVFNMGPVLITKPSTIGGPTLVPAYVRDGS